MIKEDQWKAALPNTRPGLMNDDQKLQEYQISLARMLRRIERDMQVPTVTDPAVQPTRDMVALRIHKIEELLRLCIGDIEECTG